MELENVEFKIGKFKGKTFKQVCDTEDSYNKWILSIPNVTGQLSEYKRYMLYKINNKSQSHNNPNNLKSEPNSSLRSTNLKPKYSIKRLIEAPTTPISHKNPCLNKSSPNSTPNTNVQISDKDFQIFFVNPLNTNSNNSINSGEKIKVLGTVSFEVIDDDHFKILYKKHGYNNYIPYEIYNTLDKFTPVIRLRDKDRLVTFKAEAYGDLLGHLNQQYTFEHEIEEIPNFVKRAFPKFCASGRLKPYNLSYSSAIDELEVKKRIGNSLYDTLKPFQKQGLKFGISRGGKLILGDEMGLGKTLQALAISAYYNTDWPLLIVCPSSLRFQWKDAILDWLPHLVSEQEIYTIKTSKISDLNQRAYKIVISSYDYIVRIGECLDHFNCIICDESHFIKSKNAKRTKVLLPIMKSATRVILCSGTPTLNNPSELYQQIAPLLPNFASFNDFANRYSYHNIHRFSKKVAYTGCKHGDELHALLINTIMIRRLKKNVQRELPSKIRRKIMIDIPPHLKSKFSGLLAQLGNTEEFDGNNVIVELFNMTNEAKQEGVCEYVNYLLENGHKFILFAHHISMLDLLENCAKKSGVDYIRIDGSTVQSKRGDLVKRFQNSEGCKVAILSLTACGHGLNLTAASIVVMTELYWVPGLLFQAEDRVHRIGAQGVTHVHYLIAQFTLDEIIWKLVSKKWKDVTNTLDGKKEIITLNSENMSATNPKQIDIMSCLL